MQHNRTRTSTRPQGPQPIAAPPRIRSARSTQPFARLHLNYSAPFWAPQSHAPPRQGILHHPESLKGSVAHPHRNHNYTDPKLSTRLVRHGRYSLSYEHMHIRTFRSYIHNPFQLTSRGTARRRAAASKVNHLLAYAYRRFSRPSSRLPRRRPRSSDGSSESPSDVLCFSCYNYTWYRPRSKVLGLQDTTSRQVYFGVRDGKTHFSPEPEHVARKRKYVISKDVASELECARPEQELTTSLTVLPYTANLPDAFDFSALLYFGTNCIVSFSWLKTRPPGLRYLPGVSRAYM